MHSIIGPSTSGYWAPVGGCTGFVKMAQHFPEAEDIYGPSAEGTAAHEVGEMLIKCAMVGSVDWPEKKSVVGTLASNGIAINEEMFLGAELYAKSVRSVMQTTGVFAGPLLGIEKAVKAPEINPQMWGTCDCFIFDQHTGTLYLWDYKNGRRVVDAFENWQLLCYVFGILSYLRELGYSFAHIKNIKMTIVQPNSYHESGPVRSWELAPDQLQPFMQQLIEAAAVTLSDQGVCRTGNYCRNCPARHACSALQLDAASAADFAGSPVPERLSDEALGTELSILKAAKTSLENRLTGLEEQAEQLIRSGHPVRGWAMVHSKGREFWTEPAQAASLADMLQIEIRKPNELITPKQARDLGLPIDVVSKFSQRRDGKSSLKPDDKQKIKRIFSNE